MNDYIINIKNRVVSCPTEKHLEYLQYMIDFCKEYKINLLLKGSIADGKATAFSDVDIVVIEDEEYIIEKMVSGYKKIIMSNLTERPKGILIIVYENGLCVDLDVRKKVTQSELISSVMLNCENINNFVSNKLVRNENIKIPSIPERDKWYKLLRLFHRSLIKKGCSKEKEAESILQEIRIEIEKETPALWSKDYLEDIQLALHFIEKKYVTPIELKNLIQNLIDEVGE